LTCGSRIPSICEKKRTGFVCFLPLIHEFHSFHFVIGRWSVLAMVDVLLLSSLFDE
jgi:hypothetical protein